MSVPASVAFLITFNLVRLPMKVAILQSIKGAIGDSAAYRNLQSDYASKLSGVSSLLEFDEDQDKGKLAGKLLKDDTHLFFGFGM